MNVLSLNKQTQKRGRFVHGLVALNSIIYTGGGRTVWRLNEWGPRLRLRHTGILFKNSVLFVTKGLCRIFTDEEHVKTLSVIESDESNDTSDVSYDTTNKVLMYSRRKYYYGITNSREYINSVNSIRRLTEIYDIVCK